MPSSRDFHEFFAVQSVLISSLINEKVGELFVSSSSEYFSLSSESELSDCCFPLRFDFSFWYTQRYQIKKSESGQIMPQCK